MSDRNFGSGKLTANGSKWFTCQRYVHSFTINKPNEMVKKLNELSNDELLIEVKKIKSTAIINALLIGVLIGILIYGIAVNSFGFLSLILLFAIYKLANNSKYDKKEIKSLLKERNLK